MISCTDSQQQARQSQNVGRKVASSSGERRQIRANWKIIESEISAETVAVLIHQIKTKFRPTLCVME
jgi:hypothetical protein